MTVHYNLASAGRIDAGAANDIVWALRGTFAAAERLKALYPDLAATDPDADLVEPATIERIRREPLRLPGLRDIWIAGHTQVEALRARLDADLEHVPAPDPVIVEKLSALDGFALYGKIATVDGVPLPAGRRQTDYYMVQRYRPLYGPQARAHLIYCRDPAEIALEDHSALGIAERDQPTLIDLVSYDARNVTDEAQSALLMFSVAVHRDNLVLLQHDHPALYAALWRRDMKTASKLARRVPNKSLPASNAKSGIGLPAKRLLVGASLMNEFERLFEILAAISLAHGVTRQQIDALFSTTTMTPIRPATRAFAEGAIVHTRALHPSMNAKAGPATGKPSADRSRDALQNTSAWKVAVKRMRWIEITGKEMPACYFLGVESQFLVAVALIQLIENMERHEGIYCSPGCHGGGVEDVERRAQVIELATVITAAICVESARGILRDEGKLDVSDDVWKAVVPTRLIDNPGLRDQVERLLERDQGLTGHLDVPDEDDLERKRRSSPYDRAMERARFCAPAIGEPGWTQGFRFEAWLRPHAEIAFLTDCCRYVPYDQALAVKRNACLAAHNGVTTATIATIPTGLPAEHPLIAIQDMFRSLFDRLQVAELVPEHATVKQREFRAAMIAEVAPLLAAVSPVTVDPQLAERLWIKLDPALQALAVDGAWNS